MHIDADYALVISLVLGWWTRPELPVLGALSLDDQRTGQSALAKAAEATPLTLAGVILSRLAA